MEEELQSAVACFDAARAARVLFERLKRKGLPSFSDALEVFPELQESVTAGFNSSGRMAFALLARNADTGQVIVLAAMENCVAPPHLHKSGGSYGECTFTFAGNLGDFSWTNGKRIVEKVSIGVLPPLLWEGNTFHQPFADTFWLGLYDQPRGMKLLSKMTVSEMLTTLMATAGAHLQQLYDWDTLKEEEARSIVYKTLGLVGPKQVPMALR